MARRAARPAPKAKAPAARAKTSRETEDLQIAAGHMRAHVGGQAVFVREYGFFEALDCIYAQPAFLNEIASRLEQPDTDPWLVARSLFGKHRGYLEPLIATACDRDVQWLGTLGPADTERLVATWWAVNGHFFLDEAVEQVRSQLLRNRATGSPSSSPLAAPASATSAASASSPRGS